MANGIEADLLEEASTADMARCAGPCNQVLPLTAGHFHRDSTTDTGFNRLCKKCRSEERRVEEGRIVLEAIQKLEERGLAIMEQESAEPGAAGCPHAATTFEDILTCFGGSVGFAKQVYGQYLMCKPGSSGRTKLLMQLMSIQMKLTDAGHSSIPTDQMTDDQLIERLESALNQIRKPRIHDVA